MRVTLRPASPPGMPLPGLADGIGAAPADGAGLPAITVTGVTLRAQDALPGDLFAALPGSKTHGARFAAEAVDGGAVAILTDPAGAVALPPLGGIPVLLHPTPRSVVGAAAARVYGDPSAKLTVVGVTGTSGKTTTTYLVEAGLRAAGRHAGLIGTVGVRIDGAAQPSALAEVSWPARNSIATSSSISSGQNRRPVAGSAQAIRLARMYLRR